MAVTTLRDLYQAELEDLYDAEQQIINALPRLQAAASSEDLKGAFAKHLERTRLHVERLDLIFSRLGLTRQQTKSAGIEGLIREGERRLQLSGDPNTRDAALIAAAQHVEHYEIAGYGCARTFARLIGDEAGAHLLQETLDEEGSADHELTRIAMAGINQAAGRGEHYEGPELSRLRYIDADDLDTARHSWVRHKIRNRAGDDLGKVDGVIVESSGRPYYLVVDSGGLFVGKRYLVPVGKVNLDRGNDALAVDLDKDTFKRYPEFHSSAFASMTDDEARRYEWRVLEAIDPAAARGTPNAAFRYDEFEYYRQPAWLGSEWSMQPGAERGRRVEPSPVGTTGESTARAGSTITPQHDQTKRNRS